MTRTGTFRRPHGSPSILPNLHSTAAIAFAWRRLSSPEPPRAQLIWQQLSLKMRYSGGLSGTGHPRLSISLKSDPADHAAPDYSLPIHPLHRRIHFGKGCMCRPASCRSQSESRERAKVSRTLRSGLLGASRSMEKTAVDWRQRGRPA